MAKTERTEQQKRQSDTRSRQVHWEKMMQYYRWTFMFFFLIFALVLLYEREIIPAVSMVVFAWFVSPLQCLQKMNERLGKGRVVILGITILILILYIRTLF